jgi:hypothetical protein
MQLTFVHVLVYSNCARGFVQNAFIMRFEERSYYVFSYRLRRYPLFGMKGERGSRRVWWQLMDKTDGSRCSVVNIVVHSGDYRWSRSLFGIFAEPNATGRRIVLGWICVTLVNGWMYGEGEWGSIWARTIGQLMLFVGTFKYGVCTVSGYGLADWGVGVRSPVGSNIFSTSSRPALGPTQPHIQWVLGALSTGGKAAGSWRYFELLPRSGKCGSIHPFPHTSSWRSA